MSSPTLCFCLCRSCVCDDSLRHLSANSAVSALSGFQSSPSKFLHPLCLTLVLPLLIILQKTIQKLETSLEKQKHDKCSQSKRCWNNCIILRLKGNNSGKFLPFWHKIKLIRAVLFLVCWPKKWFPFSYWPHNPIPSDRMDDRWSNHKDANNPIPDEKMPSPPPPSYAEIQPSFCRTKQVTFCFVFLFSPEARLEDLNFAP